MEKIKICLFGRHRIQYYLIELLHQLGFEKPIIILDKDSTYFRDKNILSPYNYYGDIEKLEKLNKVKIFKSLDVNSDAFIKLLKKNKINLGFSIAARSIFKKDLINYFRGKFYNLHDSLLPKERGGGLNTWRILMNRMCVGNTIHCVDVGIDTGDLIIQKEIKLKKKLPKPIDYDYAQLEISKKLLIKFFSNIKKGIFLKRVKQKSEYREYFGRLYTKINGALDVDLEPVEFERFVRAFSDPYEGAWINVLNKVRVNIKEVEIVDNKKTYPFFANGRVIKKEKNYVYLIVGQGLIKFKDIYINNKRTQSVKLIMLNDILRNHEDILLQSKNTTLHINQFK
jgi:methionyl-tRNA formyltransferase